MRDGRCDKATVYMPPIRIVRALSGLYTALSSYRVLSGSISAYCSVFGEPGKGVFFVLWMAGRPGCGTAGVMKRLFTCR